MNATPSAIHIGGLRKTYLVPEREAGLRAALHSLVLRRSHQVVAVDSISFDVAPGEIVGFLGPNGAGKTTTLKILAGLLYPSDGEISVLGHVPWQRDKAFLRQITLVMGQRNQLVWDIPVSDSFELHQAIYCIPRPVYRWTREELTNLLELEPLLPKPVRNLSLGERMNYFRLLKLFFRLSILNELQYRVNFLVQLFQSGLGLAVALGGLAVVFNHTDTLGDWRPAELLVLVGVYTLVGGLINAVIQPNLQQFMEDVRVGALDFTLIKPADPQFLVSFRYLRVWELVDVGLGLGIVVVALSRLGVSVTLWQVMAFGVTLLAGVAIVYSFWLMLATWSFWFVRLEDLLSLFQIMYQAGSWPISIYPLWLRAILTFLVPIVFAVTIPAEALVGRLTWLPLLGTVALALGLLVGSHWFWQFGLWHYTGASA